MPVYKVRRSVMEPESVYELGEETLVWRREGRAPVTLRLADVVRVRLAYFEGLAGPQPLWQARITAAGGGVIKTSSANYLGLGRTEARTDEFLAFLRAVQAAAPAGRALVVRTGDPLVLGMWLGVCLLFALLWLFAVAIVVTALSSRNWLDAATGAGMALWLTAWWGPVAWRGLKANRRRRLDLSPGC